MFKRRDQNIFTLVHWIIVSILLYFCIFYWIHWGDIGCLNMLQSCNSITHHLYIVLRVHHPQSRLLKTLTHPSLCSTCSHTIPPGNQHTDVFAYGFVCFCLIPSLFHLAPKSPQQLSVCSLYLWVFFYFVCLFYTLESTYKWNHMLFVFLWQAYFN